MIWTFYLTKFNDIYSPTFVLHLRLNLCLAVVEKSPHTLEEEDDGFDVDK